MVNYRSQDGRALAQLQQACRALSLGDEHPSDGSSLRHRRCHRPICSGEEKVGGGCGFDKEKELLVETILFETRPLSVSFLFPTSGNGIVILIVNLARLFKTTVLQEFELARTGRFFIMGTCVVAPCIRTWYLFMEKVVKFQGSYNTVSRGSGVNKKPLVCHFHD